MLNENAKKWVEKLRSGELEQGLHALHDDGKFCCLGVACELAVEEGLPLVVKEKINLDGTTYVEYDGHSGVLPEKVVEWLGLRTEEGGYCLAESLTFLNDSGATFNQIADLIESEPEGLFV
jgi:hypothetical protein